MDESQHESRAIASLTTTVAFQLNTNQNGLRPALTKARNLPAAVHFSSETLSKCRAS